MPIVVADLIYYLTKSTASADGEAGGNGLGGYRSSDAITTNTDNNLFDDITGAESASGDAEYRAMMIKNTHASLTLGSPKVWMDSNSPQTALTVELAAGGSEVSVTVSSTTGFPASGAIFVEDEEITYTSTDATNFLGASRGANGTTKALHSVGAKAEHNQLRIAIEDPSNNSTGYIQTIADESTAPTGLSWTANYTYATGLSVQDLAAGEFYGIWLRRKIPAGCNAKTGIYVTPRIRGETAE